MKRQYKGGEKVEQREAKARQKRNKSAAEQSDIVAKGSKTGVKLKLNKETTTTTTT